MAAVLAAAGRRSGCGRPRAIRTAWAGRGARHTIPAPGGDGSGKALLIDESYNANPASMRVTIALAARSCTARRRIAVLGAMKELGDVDRIRAGISQCRWLIRSRLEPPGRCRICRLAYAWGSARRRVAAMPRSRRWRKCCSSVRDVPAAGTSGRRRRRSGQGVELGRLGASGARLSCAAPSQPLRQGDSTLIALSQRPRGCRFRPAASDPLPVVPHGRRAASTALIIRVPDHRSALHLACLKVQARAKGQPIPTVHQRPSSGQAAARRPWAG